MAIILLRVAHWFFILNFLFEMAYTTYMLFSVFRPEGGGVGPLGAVALAMAPDRLLIRRLYAVEFWIACAGLATYLALTELRWRAPGNPGAPWSRPPRK